MAHLDRWASNALWATPPRRECYCELNELQIRVAYLLLKGVPKNGRVGIAENINRTPVCFSSSGRSLYSKTVAQHVYVTPPTSFHKARA